MFCPECGALMHPREGRLCCSRCGCQREVSDGERRTVREECHSRETLIIEGDAGLLPTTHDTECPKCGQREAYWVLRQTRAADEPETRIYECTKCHHRWREY
ncbi:MAG: transcription factor S [Thermoplasmata archaeon]